MSIAYATHAQAQIAANALPSGASLASGSATVTTGASTLNINQTSNRASINWNSFNVGSGASVNIAQPSASAVLLNRVTGTSAATTTDGSNAGIYAAGGTVTGKNVTLIGSATNTAASSRVLGYRGAGVSIQASDKLSITGSTQNLASGVYGFTGTYSAANGITIEGTSARGKGVGFDNNAAITNTSSGGISITGTSNDVTKNALGFQGVSITNASTDGSNTSLIARSGNVLTDSTSVGAWGGGVIQNTITNASGAGRIEVLAGNNTRAQTFPATPTTQAQLRSTACSSTPPSPVSLVRRWYTAFPKRRPASLPAPPPWYTTAPPKTRPRSARA